MSILSSHSQRNTARLCVREERRRWRVFQSVSDTNCGPILKRRLCDYHQIPHQWWPGVCQLLPGLVAPLHLCGLPDWLHTLDYNHPVYRVIILDLKIILKCTYFAINSQYIGVGR